MTNGLVRNIIVKESTMGYYMHPKIYTPFKFQIVVLDLCLTNIYSYIL